MKKAVFYILVIAILSHLVGGWVLHGELEGYFDLFSCDESLTTFWVRCELLYKFGVTLAFYIYQTQPIHSKKLSLLLISVMGLIVNDILDEMFFDPLTYQINEIVILSVMLLAYPFYARQQ